ncbi:thioredoxin 1 [Halopseudomonas xinjiangensis]|uniref:Thioredoxin 1 n=1 Tax=Halopseudomonas xinjiangensis TaxID=487184 RepID=A0A1H1T478_9GAMM|nr:thioredoxin family protein [Halopseudomonas xinjiangensis]SDS55052.1 thioredoxin 1 [Halopseudomonas xinjiangensis]
MGMNHTYTDKEPTRDEVDSLDGPTVIEFGTAWCGYCRGAQDDIAAAFEDHSTVRHLKIEDGPGRRLGRSFRVKLWPTLVFMRDGQEVERLVRPADAQSISRALSQIDS